MGHDNRFDVFSLEVDRSAHRRILVVEESTDTEDESVIEPSRASTPSG